MTPELPEATHLPARGKTWSRYVAIGDSFTEGMSDVDPHLEGRYIGWADRLAAHLATLAGEAGHDFAYANLAVRGRLLADVIGLQLDLGHHPVLQDAGDDAAHPVAGGLVGDAAHGCGRGDLLGDGGQVGACDDHPPSGVPVAGQSAGVDHPADRVVGDPQQGGGL